MRDTIGNAQTLGLQAPYIRRVVTAAGQAGSNSGFTLIELLVVISIIGLLASVVLVALNSARAKSRDAKRIGDVRQFSTALELFYNDASAYPTNTNYVAGARFGQYVLQAYGSSCPAGVCYMTPTYVTNIPTAPNPQDTGGTGSYVANTPGVTCAASGKGSNIYWYEVPTTGRTYTITFCLGDSTGNVSDGVHFMTPGGLR